MMDGDYRDFQPREYPFFIKWGYPYGEKLLHGGDDGSEIDFEAR